LQLLTIPGIRSLAGGPEEGAGVGVGVGVVCARDTWTQT
jgi:hypothetical protein